jgi:hypothetical protein
VRIHNREAEEEGFYALGVLEFQAHSYSLNCTKSQTNILASCTISWYQLHSMQCVTAYVTCTCTQQLLATYHQHAPYRLV